MVAETKPGKLLMGNTMVSRKARLCGWLLIARIVNLTVQYAAKTPLSESKLISSTCDMNLADATNGSCTLKIISACSTCCIHLSANIAFQLPKPSKFSSNSVTLQRSYNATMAKSLKE